MCISMYVAHTGLLCGFLASKIRMSSLLSKHSPLRAVSPASMHLLLCVDKKWWTEKCVSKCSKLSSHCLIRLNFDCLDFTVEIGFSVPRAFSLPSLTPPLPNPALQPQCSSALLSPWFFTLLSACSVFHSLFPARVDDPPPPGPTPTPFHTLSHISEPSDFLLFSLSLCEKIYGILDTFSATFTSSSAYHKVSWLNKN